MSADIHIGVTYSVRACALSATQSLVWRPFRAILRCQQGPADSRPV